MKHYFVVAWITGHATLAGLLWLCLSAAAGEKGEGVAFFSLPVAFGLFQARMLRAWIRPWWWVAASVMGFFASFLFMWVFIAAIGFTVSLAQAFCFRVHPRFLIGLAWTVLGAAGWMSGLLAGGSIMPSSGTFGGTVLYTTTSLVYAAALLPALCLVARRPDAASTTAASQFAAPPSRERS